MIYASIMVFLGQFTSVNAVMYYMSKLMQAIGFGDKDAVFMSPVDGGALLIGAIPAVLYMERFGRRYWANAMLPGFFIGLVLVGVGYTIDADKYPSAAQGVYLTGIVLYMGFFGSYACLTWVVPSEVFPRTCRIGLTLGFYGGIAVLDWVYQIIFMPETKNKSLEEINEIFSLRTAVIAKRNLKQTAQVIRDLSRFRLKKVFSPEPYN
ncbi:Major facilitator superfamily domain, general substrate transporter [Penicillium expansum]|nr:Major facilitator superfamily domain, general substrate transporter [Penicillium expansum]